MGWRNLGARGIVTYSVCKKWPSAKKRIEPSAGGCYYGGVKRSFPLPQQLSGVPSASTLSSDGHAGRCIAASPVAGHERTLPASTTPAGPTSGCTANTAVPADLVAQLLEESRLLRTELEALRAEKFALRERQIARLALSDRTIVVSEHELPAFVPYTLRQIQTMRMKGKLVAKPCPRSKNRFIYNLRDVEATLMAGKPAEGPLVKNIDWDSIKIAV